MPRSGFPLSLVVENHLSLPRSPKVQPLLCQSSFIKVTSKTDPNSIDTAGNEPQCATQFPLNHKSQLLRRTFFSVIPPWYVNVACLRSCPWDGLNASFGVIKILFPQQSLTVLTKILSTKATFHNDGRFGGHESLVNRRVGVGWRCGRAFERLKSINYWTARLEIGGEREKRKIISPQSEKCCSSFCTIWNI